MREEESLRNDFEGLKARLLTVDVGDGHGLGRLQTDLQSIHDDLDSSLPAASTIGLCLRTLDAAMSGRSDASTLLATVTVAVAAVVRDIEWHDGESAAAMEQADGELRRLLDAPASPAQTTTCLAATILPPDSDLDLLREFICESCDRLATAEVSLLALEANPTDDEHINTILRAFHTIKGASGFLGLDAVQRLAHLAENLLIRGRDGTVLIVGPQADLALRACDTLRAMVQGLDGVQPGQALAIPAGFEILIETLSCDTKSEAKPSAKTEPASLPPQMPTGTKLEPETLQQHPATSAEGASIRIDTDRLDALVDMVGELVIAHSIVAQDPAVAQAGQATLARRIAQTGKIVRGLQDLTLTLRMVPLKATFQKMARLVRDLSRKSGKAVQLVTCGDDTEIDRNMVEVLSDPLVHMIRNAVDHGIETAEERIVAGKPETGTVRLNAYQAAGSVVIEVSDDGRGLSRERILSKAAALGLVDSGRPLSDAEVYALIFHPGLTTAAEVTDISGRGVGMDVVKKSVDLVRGRIEVGSAAGKGTMFTLRLPLTMAVADAMQVRVGTQRYLLPMVAIQQSFPMDAGAVTNVAGCGEVVTLRGQTLPLMRLNRLLGVDGGGDPERGILVVIEGDGRRCALAVDELIGQQQVVIKALGEMLARTPGVSGAAIMGDGRVGLILDATGLVQLAQGNMQAA
jgi:two-component system, chemotaxis family, sensor kinase CheA